MLQIVSSTKEKSEKKKPLIWSCLKYPSLTRRNNWRPSLRSFSCAIKRCFLLPSSAGISTRGPRPRSVNYDFFGKTWCEMEAVLESKFARCVFFLLESGFNLWSFLFACSVFWPTLCFKLLMLLETCVFVEGECGSGDCSPPDQTQSEPSKNHNDSTVQTLDQSFLTGRASKKSSYFQVEYQNLLTKK